MEILVTLVIWLALAYWCWKIASGNGRDKLLAIIMGLLFGIIAVIVYAILGQTEEEKDKRVQKIVDERLSQTK